MSAKSITLETLKAEIELAGFTPSVCSWEDDSSVYACSVEGNFHPDFEASYCKETGWLSIQGKQPEKLKG